LDDEETAMYNERIDATFLFENLLRAFDDRPKEKIVEAFNALKDTGALPGRLPKLPWADVEDAASPKFETAAISTDESTEQDETTIADNRKFKSMWKKGLLKVRAGVARCGGCLSPAKGTTYTTAGTEGEKRGAGNGKLKLDTVPRS
jgi:hypothetical protein